MNPNLNYLKLFNKPKGINKNLKKNSIRDNQVLLYCINNYKKSIFRGLKRKKKSNNNLIDLINSISLISMTIQKYIKY